MKDVVDLMEKYRKMGVTASVAGHIAGPSWHPCFQFPSEWRPQKIEKIAVKLKRDLDKIRLKHGASIGEQGMFTEYVNWYKATFGDRVIDLIKQIKKVFDPNDILVPGKLSAQQHTYKK